MLFAGLTLLAIHSPLRAADHTVCASGCDFTTIAAAVAAASNFDSIVVNIALPNVHTESGILVTTKILTIEGLGRDVTVVQAAESTEAATSNIISVFTNAALTVQDLTLRHGNTAFGGGAISVSGGPGRSSDLVVQRVRMHNNSADQSGGAIDGRGNSSVTIDDSIFDSNTAGGGGGAVSATDLIMTGTLAHDNSATFGGGVTASGVSRVRNSTIVDNQATNLGGGLVLSGASVAATHVTVVGNSAPTGAGIAGGTGVSITSSVIANNPGGDCDLPIFAFGSDNWDSDGSCSDTVGSGDPRLSPLRDNGGPTWTMAPTEESPLVDAVAPEGVCFVSDQRGVQRPGLCDIGAYERFELETCETLNAAIPDAAQAGVTDTVVLGFGTPLDRIIDVNVSVFATHSWVGDLLFELSHNGVTVPFIDRPGYPAAPLGCSEGSILASFDDDDPDPVEDECSESGFAIGGRFAPSEPLAAFNDSTGPGDWTITVSDLLGGETGTFHSWCVYVEMFTGPPLSIIFSDGFESGGTGNWD